MKKVFMLFVVAILATVMVACGSNTKKEEPSTGVADKEGDNPATEEVQELTIKHELDETVVSKNPEKVISFDFGALDTLDKLGVEVIGLPKGGTLPAYLAKYDDEKYVNVGTLKEPDFEKVHELQPDLIIISARQAEMYDEFKGIAPTIYVGLDNEKYLESFQENTKTLASIFGKEAEVEEELQNLDEQIKAVHDAAQATGKKALIILANEGKISAYGSNSRFGIIHDVLGFAPVDENIEVSTHGQGVDFEYIAEKNPDYLFVIDRGAVVSTGSEDSSAKQIIENELVETTNAFKDGKIIYLDPNFWYLSGGGLISVAEMVKEVEASLQ